MLALLMHCYEFCSLVRYCMDVTMKKLRYMFLVHILPVALLIILMAFAMVLLNQQLK
jgi:hypothetical protein